jgi:maleate cis-trans isomerase
MPLTQDPPRLGFLYPGYAAEDDYPRLAARLPSQPVVELVHTSVGEDAHRIDALLDLGGPERLADGAERLAGKVDVAVWACTSGSFVFGWDGARQQADAISARLGVPASSTSFAFVDAIRAIGASKVAIAATYPDDVAMAFADFLAEPGIEVTSVGSEGIVTATEVGTFDAERVLSFVAAADHADAEAILVPDTALHSVDVIDELERRLDKPVLTANQVTMWHALRLCGADAKAEGPGVLFRGD